MEAIKKSPCLGICSTVYGDQVCKGCKRNFDEIIAWNSWNDAQKNAVYARLEKLMQEAMAPYLHIPSSELLETELKRQSIPYRHFNSAYWWLFLLWVKKPDALDSWERLGIQIEENFKETPPTALLNRIDDAVNTKAQALFDANST